VKSLSKPRVTIGVPVFNGERYLAEALLSIQRQDYPDIEVIISDNASDDATADIANSFVRDDDRFTYHRTDNNVGGARNMNILLERANSPLFKWAYHDDVCAPSLVSACVAQLEAVGDKAAIAYPRVSLIDDAGDVIGAHGDEDLYLSASEPHRRIDVLLRRVVSQVQFGVMRTELLRASGGAAASIGGEMVMPLAMCLRGTAELVPLQLQLIRAHAERHGGHRAAEASWVDPSRPRTAFPYSRSTTQLLAAIRRSPLSRREKRRCAVVVLRAWTVPGWRTLVGDLLRLPEDLGLLKPNRTLAEDSVQH
jgi:Glycosyl transferase family 2